MDQENMNPVPEAAHPSEPTPAIDNAPRSPDYDASHDPGAGSVGRDRPMDDILAPIGRILDAAAHSEPRLQRGSRVNGLARPSKRVIQVGEALHRASKNLHLFGN